MATCLSNQVKCVGLFIPTYHDISDVQGAAILIESINSYKNYRIIDVDTNRLREKGEHITKEMEDMIILMLAQNQRKEDQNMSRARMYT